MVGSINQACRLSHTDNKIARETGLACLSIFHLSRHVSEFCRAIVLDVSAP